MRPSCAHGLTLIELLTAIAVVAVTLAFAVPTMKAAIRANRLAAGGNQFVSALNLARSEAVKTGMRVTVRKTSANWEQGWRVFVDAPPNYGTFESTADTVVREYPPLAARYTLRGNGGVANYISFLSSGQSNTMGSFALCDMSDNKGTDLSPRANASRLIIVNSVGRVRQGIDGNNNGIPENDNGVDLSSCVSP